MIFSDFIYKLFIGFVFLFCGIYVCVILYMGYLYCFKHDVWYKNEMRGIARSVKEKCLDTNMKICEVCLEKGVFSCDNKTILKSKQEIEDFVKRYGE